MRFRLKNGLAIGYNTRGMGPLAVMMPPIGCPMEFWDPVIAELEGTARVIAIEPRGHGESDVPPGPFTLDELAADVVELLRAVNGGQKAVIGGCSMGAMIAQGACLAAPELFSGLIIANTTHERTDQAREIMAGRAAESMKGMPATMETTINRWFNKTYQAAHPEHVALSRDWLSNACPVVHSWSWSAIRDLNYGDRLKSLPMPIMAVAGGDDQSSSADEVRAMAESLGCEYRVVDDAGHATPLENPKAFAACITEMLARS